MSCGSVILCAAVYSVVKECQMIRVAAADLSMLFRQLQTCPLCECSTLIVSILPT